jgi:hypothetical protein
LKLQRFDDDGVSVTDAWFDIAIFKFDTEANTVSLKIPNLDSDRVVVTSPTGELKTLANITSAEIGMLDNCASNIQGQLTGKQGTLTATAPLTLTGNTISLGAVTEQNIGRYRFNQSANESELRLERFDYDGTLNTSSWVTMVSYKLETSNNQVDVVVVGLETNKVVVTGLTGALRTVAVTQAEVLTLASCTSNIQGQIDSKLASDVGVRTITSIQSINSTYYMLSTGATPTFGATYITTTYNMSIGYKTSYMPMSVATGVPWKALIKYRIEEAGDEFLQLFLGTTQATLGAKDHTPHVIRFGNNSTNTYTGITPNGGETLFPASLWTQGADRLM